jgi:predicted lipopolysaccharide heptosyltransferase III
MPAAAPRFLVIRRRYLGDIVLLGSVLRNLKISAPDAFIAVLTEQAYSGILPLNPDVNLALAFPRRISAWPRFITALRRERFTHVLDFDNTEKTALVSRLTGARVRVAFDRELIPFRYRALYTHSAKVTNAFYDSHHITETYLALPAAIGIPIVSREVRLVPPSAESARARELVSSAAGPNAKKILLHPGSRSAHRIWPADRFAAVCDRLQREHGARVFLTAGPAEAPLVDAIRSAAKTELAVIPPSSSVAEFAALAAQFDLFLCHDSGPMHIVAAVGTPVVALFGSQNATIWRPLGEKHSVLQTSLPCACIGAAAPTPCVRNDSYRSYCVRMLSVEAVFTALARILGAPQLE